MKVLFAVSNEEISESIIKRYQKENKQIISYKNVYYFNAILKEIQKDKTYDRIVISEDLESFTHTQYDQIDKFIFDKLDSISDEASDIKGNDTPIILICSDRRTLGEQMLVKLFSIGIYDAIIGNDRSVEEVCKLIKRPRSKKEAKAYYKIDSEEATYQPENENDVSEMEIQNILAHYKRLGKNEDRYIESFNNIAAQYNDTQLRVISNFLPLNVRAVLEEKSVKYQQIMSFNNSVSEALRKNKQDKNEKSGPTQTLLKPKNKDIVMTKPVVIPSTMSATGVRRLSKQHPNNVTNNNNNIEQQNNNTIIQETNTMNIQDDNISPILNSQKQQISNINANSMNTTQPVEKEQEISIQPVKRGRGRPRKNPEQEETNVNQPKRGRGRPRKNVVETENATNTNILPGLEEQPSSSILPGLEEQPNSNIVPGLDEQNDMGVLPGFETQIDSEVLQEAEQKQENINTLGSSNNRMYNTDNIPNPYDINNIQNLYDINNLDVSNIPSPYDVQNQPINNKPNAFDAQSSNQNETQNSAQNSNAIQESPYEIEDIEESYNYENNVQNQSDNNYSSSYYSSEEQSNNDTYVNTIDITRYLTPDKKIATFVGTSKNGTSFIVNNMAELLSSRGINTAILDVTKNKNSYYIYTKNEEELRKVAQTSFEGLVNGSAYGIKVNPNLTVYTSVPSEDSSIIEVDKILETLLKNHSLILIDSDFDSPIGYFKQTQELYLVQSLDILTIQPLTAFLRKLKAKDALDEKKIRIILNKAFRVKGITDKTIIGGMAYYNDPAMSYMTELFDRNMVKYINIPFNEDAYILYLEGIINCEISLRGYPKAFIQQLSQLGEMIYRIDNTSKTYQPPSVGKFARNNNGNMDNSNFSPELNNTLNQMRRY